MKRTLLSIAVATAAAVAVGPITSFARSQQAPPPEPPAQAQPAAEASPCHDVLSDSGRLGGTLSAVSRYGTSYVLVVPQRFADKVPNVGAPGLRDLEVGVQSGSAAGDAARAIGITKIREYPYSASAAAQPLQDVADGKLDAAVLWAPLAGAGILELGLDGQVSVFTIDRPHDPPAALHAQAVAGPCSAAIRDELDANGVLPAELLVPVDIRALMATKKVPAFDVEHAREGAQVYNDVCSRCHGPDAVADPHGLAPVDLRISIQRFSFAGFNYIVLNGRPSKSMPPLRGTVTDDQISLIYQYLKARSEKLLPASAH